MRITFPILLLTLAGACEPARDAAPSVLVQDDLGRDVRFRADVRRVVTLAPNLTEIVFAAGAGYKLVGVTDADDYPTEVLELPRFSALPVDYEAILALGPDLVLASDQVNSLNDAATFAAVGMPVYFFSIRSLEQMLQSIRTAGILLGAPDRAAGRADSLRASLSLLGAYTKDVKERPSTLFLIGDDTLYAFGRGSYIHDVISLAGGESITASFPTRAPIISDEFVLTHKPQVIIGAFGASYDLGRLLQLHPTWDLVPALRDGRAFFLDADLFLRPSPRLVEGAWRMAERLHPNLDLPSGS